jgi:hypothetical protein
MSKSDKVERYFYVKSLCQRRISLKDVFTYNLLQVVLFVALDLLCQCLSFIFWLKDVFTYNLLQVVLFVVLDFSCQYL